MVDSTILKSVFVVFVLLVVLCGNIRLLRQFRNSDELEKSLKRIMKLLVISGFLSDVINLVNLLISTSSGKITMQTSLYSYFVTVYQKIEYFDIYP